MQSGLKVDWFSWSNWVGTLAVVFAMKSDQAERIVKCDSKYGGVVRGLGDVTHIPLSSKASSETAVGSWRLSIGDLSHSLSVRLIPDEERTESAKDFAVELDLGKWQRMPR